MNDYDENVVDAMMNRIFGWMNHRRGNRETGASATAGTATGTARGTAAGASTRQREPAAPPEGAPPPAAPSAIRQLATIEIQAEDLVDETNRECCICLEPHNLRQKVLRLPCAHFFHPTCIGEWLQKHCTCPTCRYELPTLCPHYERGRKARMALRKPRYARHELDRLSIQQLQALLQRLPQSASTHWLEKRDLVQALMDSGAIDIVTTPPPVSYRWSTLQNMGISQLKHCMNQAGVFFSSKEVVEKTDMLHIFYHSGRLELLPEQQQPQEPAQDNTLNLHQATADDTAATSNVFLQVETVLSDSEAEEDEDDRKMPARTSSNDDHDDQHLEGTWMQPTSNTIDNHTGAHPSAASIVAHARQRQPPPQDDHNGHNTAPPFALQELQSLAVALNVDIADCQQDAGEIHRRLARHQESEEEQQQDEQVAQAGDDAPMERTIQEDEEEQDVQMNDDAPMERTIQEDVQINDDAPAERTVQEDEQERQDVQVDGDAPMEHTIQEDESEEIQEQDAQMNGDAPMERTIQEDDEPPLAAYTATASRSNNNDSSPPSSPPQQAYDRNNGQKRPRQGENGSVIESMHNQEEQDRLRSYTISQLKTLARERGIDLSHCLERSEMIALLLSSQPTTTSLNTLLQQSSISELRAMARHVGVDLSHCHNQEEMIEQLQQVIQQQQHVANYLQALYPLVTMTVPQLRAQAREWQVNVNDCLEKGDMIHRLVASRL